MKVVDLFCGCGGLSLGFQMAGHDVIFGLDNNSDALETFRANFPKAKVCKKDILELSPKDIPDCDILVGGPPCVNFSTAKGSRANILEGLKLVQAFLRIVYYKKPKYWIMENVPRVGLHLPEKIPLKWLGINKEGFLPTPTKNELSAQDFGAPQKRTRLLIGNYPKPQPISHQNHTLGDVIKALNAMQSVKDINYGRTIKKSALSDHQKIFMSDIEVHHIREGKTNHPYMGFMPFPDDLNKPARTVVALQMGRETLVIQEGKKFRRATVRECATIQTFPIEFHFFGKSIASRYRQAGNAVPPLLSFNIARSISVKEEIAFPQTPYIYKTEAPPPPSMLRPKQYNLMPSKDRIIQIPYKIVRGFRVELVSRQNKKSFVQIIEGEGKLKKKTFKSEDVIEYVDRLILFYNLNKYAIQLDSCIKSTIKISAKELHRQISENPITGSPALNKSIQCFKEITDKIEGKEAIRHLEKSPFSNQSIRIKSLLAIHFANQLIVTISSIL